MSKQTDIIKAIISSSKSDIYRVIQLSKFGNVRRVYSYIGKQSPEIMKALNRQDARVLEKHFGKDYRSTLGIFVKTRNFGTSQAVEATSIATKVTSAPIEEIFGDELIQGKEVPQAPAARGVRAKGQHEVVFVESLISENENVFDLKMRIAAYTKLSPFKQHLFIENKNGKNINISYVCPFLGEDEQPDLSLSQRSSSKGETVYGVPITGSFENVVIQNTEDTVLYQFGHIGNNVLVISLDEYIGNIGDENPRNRAVFYNGFILKYFPFIRTMNQFTDLLNKVDLFDIDDIRAYIIKKDEVEAELAVGRSATDGELIDRSSVTSVLLSNKKYGVEHIFDIQTCFNLLHCDDKIPIMTLFHGSIIITKEYEPYYESMHLPLKQTKKIENKLQLRLRMDANSSAPLYNRFIIVNIFANGYIKVSMSWEEELAITPVDIIHFISYVNRVIENINGVGGMLFYNRPIRLKQIPLPLNKVDLSIENINISIFFTARNYSGLTKYLEKLSPLIGKYKEETSRRVIFYENMYAIRLYRKTQFGGMKGAEYSIGEYGASNSFKNEPYKWSNVMVNCATNTGSKIQLRGVTSLYELRQSARIMYGIVSMFLKAERAAGTDVTDIAVRSKRKLRRLQLLDYSTYTYRQYTDYKPYAKMCQNVKQPDVIPEKDYRKLPDEKKKKYMRLPNNSRPGEFLYYTCKNNAFHKHISFIDRNRHPTSKCMVCCSKVDPRRFQQTKKFKLFRSCTTTPKEKPIQKELPGEEIGDQQLPSGISTKYITNYSPRISARRFSNLPEQLEIIFNTVDIEARSVSAYKIYGTPRQVHNFAEAVYYAWNSDAIRESVEDGSAKMLKRAIDYVDNSGLFQFLEHGELRARFGTVKKFREVINSHSYNPKFDRIFLKSLLEYSLGITIVIIVVGDEDIHIEFSKQSGSQLLDKTRPIVVLVETSFHNYYPIFLISISQYSAGYKNVSRIIKTKYESSDKIISEMLRVFEFGKDIEERVVEYEGVEYDRQFLNAQGIVMFVRLINGLIIPYISEPRINIQHKYIEKHEEIENKYDDKFAKKCSSFLSGKKGAIKSYIALNQKVVGLLLANNLILYISPSDLKRVSRDFGDKPIVYMELGISYDMVNRNISKGVIEDDKRTKNVGGIKFDIELYNVIKLSFANKISLERDEKKRDMIWKLLVAARHKGKPLNIIVSDLRGNDIEDDDIRAIVGALSRVEAESSTNITKERHIEKKILESIKFTFDYRTKKRVIAAIEASDKVEVGRITKKIFDSICRVTEHKRMNEFPFDKNIRFTCEEGTLEKSFCARGMLNLSRKEYITFLGRLVNDIYQDDITRTFLLNGVYPRTIDSKKFPHSEDNVIIIEEL